MKCKHEKEITVILTKHSDVCWDDGIYTYDENGRYDILFGDYLKVEGCDKCKTVKIEVR